MSVKSTVASTRSGSRLLREPVRNSSISSIVCSAPSWKGKWSLPSSSTYFASGDVLGQITPGLDRDHPVAGAMDDERRHADRRQDVANVDLHRDPEPGERRRRRAREATGLCVPLPEPLVADHRRSQRVEAEVAAAPLRLVGDEDRLQRVLVEAPRIVGRPRSPRVRRRENERRRPLRERRGEERADRAALGTAEQRCPLRAGGVHHGEDVVHHLLVGADLEDPVGEPRAAPVEDDQARERRDPVEERLVRRPPLVLLEVRHVARREDEIDRPVAEHLVRDVELAALRVSRLALHAGQSRSWSPTRL